MTATTRTTELSASRPWPGGPVRPKGLLSVHQRQSRQRFKANTHLVKLETVSLDKCLNTISDLLDNGCKSPQTQASCSHKNRFFRDLLFVLPTLWSCSETENTSTYWFYYFFYQKKHAEEAAVFLSALNSICSSATLSQAAYGLHLHRLNVTWEAKPRAKVDMMSLDRSHHRKLRGNSLERFPSLAATVDVSSELHL